MAGAGGMAGSGGMAGNGGMAGSGGMVVECDGDGVIDAGEECDDMNGDAGDGCEDCVVVCPGWIKDPNPPHHCYRVFTDQQNWATSRTECQDEAPSEGFPAGSTELAAISSDPEMTFLEAVVAPLTDGPWLGAIESMATDCQYSWSNGEPWGWSPNPDPTPSTGLTDKPWNMGGPVAPPCNTYTCVHIYNTGRFHEEMCTTPHGRLCEFTPPGN
jgi:cysteine-rich repeat protein